MHSPRLPVLHHTHTHAPAERRGFWMVFCYEYCWAWRPAVIDDFGNLVRVHPGNALHSLS